MNNAYPGAVAPLGFVQGQKVMVRWSDGGEYPAVVTAIHGDQLLCRLQHGNETWVGARFVRVIEQHPAAHAYGHAVHAPAGAHVPHVPTQPGAHAAPAPYGSPAQPARLATHKNKHTAAFVVLGVAVLGFVALAVILSRGRAAWPLSLLDDDAELASYAQEMSTAMLNAALSKPHDSRWNGIDPGSDLRGTNAEAKRVIASLGGEPRIVLVAVELQASIADGTGHKNLRTMAAVTKTGDLRFVEATRDRYDFPALSPMYGLEQAEPMLAAAVRRVVDELAGGCELPVLRLEDVADMPPKLQHDILRKVDDIPKACLSGSSTAGWTPKVDDVVAVVEAGGKWAILKSELELASGKLRLAPVGVKVLD